MVRVTFVRGTVIGDEIREIGVGADHTGLIGHEKNFDFNSE